MVTALRERTQISADTTQGRIYKNFQGSSSGAFGTPYADFLWEEDFIPITNDGTYYLESRLISNATIVGGAPDPVMSLIGHVMYKVEVLSHRLGTLEQALAYYDSSEGEDLDAVVFGAPLEIRTFKAKVIGFVEGEPLIVSGEVDE